MKTESAVQISSVGCQPRSSVVEQILGEMDRKNIVGGFSIPEMPAAEFDAAARRILAKIESL